MRVIMILIMKFLCSLIAFAVGLNLFFSATLTEIVSFSLLITVVSYLLGDRIVLPLFGNATATIVDFFLTYAAVWIFGNIVLHSYLQIAWGSILAAVIVMIGEVFLHYYLLTQQRDQDEEVARSSRRRIDPNMTFMTEFAEENENNNPYKED